MLYEVGSDELSFVNGEVSTQDLHIRQFVAYAKLITSTNRRP